MISFNTCSQTWMTQELYKMYVFTQPLHHEQDVTPGQFLNIVLLI